MVDTRYDVVMTVKRITIWVDTDVMKDLQKLADREDRSLAYMMRRAIADFVAAEKAAKKGKKKS